MDLFLDLYATLLLPLLYHNAADSILLSLHYAALPWHGHILCSLLWMMSERVWRGMGEAGITLPVWSEESGIAVMYHRLNG